MLPDGDISIRLVAHSRHTEEYRAAGPYVDNWKLARRARQDYARLAGIFLEDRIQPCPEATGIQRKKPKKGERGMLDERRLLALPVRVGHRLSSEITAIARRKDPRSTCPPGIENASSVATHPHPRFGGGGEYIKSREVEYCTRFCRVLHVCPDSIFSCRRAFSHPPLLPNNKIDYAAPNSPLSFPVGARPPPFGLG